MRAAQQEKAKVVESLRDRFLRAKGILLTTYQGMTVEQMQELRRHLRQSSLEFRVVKNTLARRAVAETDAAPLGDHFVGPVGVVWGYEDPVTPVKAVKAFSKKVEAFQWRVGLLEGQLLDAQGLEAVSNLPTREELLGRLVMALRSPLHGLAGTLQGIPRKLVYALNALREARTSEA